MVGEKHEDYARLRDIILAWTSGEAELSGEDRAKLFDYVDNHHPTLRRIAADILIHQDDETGVEDRVRLVHALVGDIVEMNGLSSAPDAPEPALDAPGMMMMPADWRTHLDAPPLPGEALEHDSGLLAYDEPIEADPLGHFTETELERRASSPVDRSPAE